MEESDYLSLPPHKGVARWSTVNLFPHWCNGNYGEVCRPKRRSRLSQERLGSALSRREGRFLSQPRTRHSSEFVRQPKRAGNMTPTILPRSFC